MAQARPPQPPSNTDNYAAGREASASTDDRFGGDVFLRNWGFVIVSRPLGEPAVWKRLSDGRLFTEREARASAVLARARAMKDLEAKK